MLLSITQLVLSLALAPTAYCYPLLAERATVVDDVSQLKAAYDYVVIGGGTSGLTVANRLTENDQSTSNGGNCPLRSFVLTKSCVGQSRFL